MAFFSGGLAFNSDGSLQVNSDTVTTVFSVRLPADSLGKVWVDSTNTPTAASTRLGGLAFTATGALFCTTAAVSASSVRDGGIARTALGALHITYLPPARKFFVGGFCCDTDGVVFVSAVDGDVAFYLPFTDLGAGVVDTTEAIAGATSTFTRATAGAAKLSTGLWKLDVASGVARYSYDGATTAVSTTGGYFHEGARTQLALNPRDMTQAAWVAVNVTPTQVATGITGVANSATRLTSGAIGGSVQQTLVAAASSRTVSHWIRRVTGTGTITINQGATTLDVTASINSATYTRVELNASVLNAAFGITFGASGDVIDVDCNQFEAGGFASSPIPAAGTRNTDFLTYAVASSVTGTLFGAGQATAQSGTRVFWEFNDTTANNAIGMFDNATNLVGVVVNGGVTQASMGVTDAGTAAFKAALAYAVNDFATVINAGTPTTDAAGTIPTTTRVQIGNNGNANVPWFGTISRVAYWRSRIPNTSLQSMTG